MKLYFTLALTVLMLASLNANAQWGLSADSLTVINNGATFGGAYVTYNYCTDGANGVIVCWENGMKVFTQRVDANGNLKWGANGLLLSDTIGEKQNPRIAEDGYGGAYIIWEDANSGPAVLMGQRVDSNGNFLWQTGGLQLLFSTVATPFSCPNAYIINNNGIGAYITAEEDETGGFDGLAAERIDVNGKPVWDSAGIPFSAFQDYRQPQITADGYGGFVTMYWSDTNDSNSIYLQRFDSSGHMHFPGTNGLPLNTEVALQFPDYNLSLDNDNNILATWDAYTTQGVYAQKVDSGGNYLWGSHEVFVCDTSSGESNYPDILSDGTGGAYIAWTDDRYPSLPERIYAQRLNASGAGQWRHNGICLDTLNTYNPNPSLVPDVNNGVRVFWASTDTNEHVKMQRVDLNGNTLCETWGTRVTPYNTVTILYGNRSVLPSQSGDILLGYVSPLDGLYAKYVPPGCEFPAAYMACDSLLDNFSYSGTTDTFQFTSLASANSGTVMSWQWNFSDPTSGTGDTSSLADPLHLYDTAGTYNVCLIVSGGVTNHTCIDTFCKTVTVFPNNPNYSACDSLHNNFSFITVGDTVQFTGAATVNGGAIMSWSWNFADVVSDTADTSSNQYPTHIFSAPGNYDVCLTVTGGISNHTCTDTFCKTVTIVPSAINVPGNYQIALYPDPATDYFIIDYNGTDERLTGRLYDLSGRVLETLLASKGKNYFDVKNVGSGVYFLKLLNADNTLIYQKKMVVIR